MLEALILLLVAVTVAAVFAAGRWTTSRGRRDRPVSGADAVRRILLPFTGASISRRAFDAAVRLARAENATLMPCYLATVPLNLPLESALPAQCLRAMPLLETLEQRAAAQHVSVDARIVRGRTYRDALRRILGDEQFDRVIVSADHNQGAGFSGQDLVWLLDRADAEVLILRPAPADHRQVAAQVAGHF